MGGLSGTGPVRHDCRVSLAAAMVNPRRRARLGRGTVAGTEKPLPALSKKRYLVLCLGGEIVRRVGAGGTASITVSIQVFKTGVSSDPAQAGSIPVRLR
jgi:hypothetical protein